MQRQLCLSNKKSSSQVQFGPHYHNIPLNGSQLQMGTPELDGLRFYHYIMQMWWLNSVAIWDALLVCYKVIAF